MLLHHSSQYAELPQPLQDVQTMQPDEKLKQRMRGAAKDAGRWMFKQLASQDKDSPQHVCIPTYTSTQMFDNDHHSQPRPRVAYRSQPFMCNGAFGSRQTSEESTNTGCSDSDTPGMYSSERSDWTNASLNAGGVTHPQANRVPPPGVLLPKVEPAPVPSASVLGEPMKVEMGSHHTSLHPLAQAQKDLRESIVELCSHLQEFKEQSVAALACDISHSATCHNSDGLLQQQIASELHQLQMQLDASNTANRLLVNAAVPLGPIQVPFPGNSPLVPYLLAELASASSPPPTDFLEMQQQHHSPPASEPAASKTVLSRKSVKGDARAKGNKAAMCGNSSVGAGVGVGKSMKDATQDQDCEPQHVRAADSHRTFVAFKVNRLGFDADHILKEHFSKFGQVDYVCVPRKVKQQHSPGQFRFRPSGLGFVVMTREEDLQAILASGPEHLVCEKVINVRAFQGKQEQG